MAAAIAGLNKVIVTSLVVIAPGQGPLLMVQRYTFAPNAIPETVVVGLVAFAKVPVPLTTVQVPLAGAVAAFAARDTETTGAHRFWAGPAFAAAAFRSNTLMTTSSVGEFGGHGPLLMVQRRVVTPTGIPVTVEVGEFGLVMVAVPLTTVQVPVAGASAAVAAREVAANEEPDAVQRL